MRSGHMAMAFGLAFLRGTHRTLLRAATFPALLLGPCDSSNAHNCATCPLPDTPHSLEPSGAGGTASATPILPQARDEGQHPPNVAYAISLPSDRVSAHSHSQSAPPFS